jgi:hypothetical protein
MKGAEHNIHTVSALQEKVIPCFDHLVFTY